MKFPRYLDRTCIRRRIQDRHHLSIHAARDALVLVDGALVEIGLAVLEDELDLLRRGPRLQQRLFGLNIRRADDATRPGLSVSQAPRLDRQTPKTITTAPPPELFRWPVVTAEDEAAVQHRHRVHQLPGNRAGGFSELF